MSMTFANRWNLFIYSLWAPVYDLLLRFHPATEARAQAFEKVQIGDASRVLLVGVGTGIDLEFLKPSVNVIGIDLSPAMLRQARRRAQRLGRRFRGVCGDVSQMPFDDDQFDVVILTLIVSVVPDPRQCLLESLRVLQPSGCMLVMDKFVPQGDSASSIRRVFNLLTRFFGTDINRRWETMSAGLPLEILDEASALGGSFRSLIIRKQLDAT